MAPRHVHRLHVAVVRIGDVPAGQHQLYFAGVERGLGHDIADQTDAAARGGARPG